MLRYVINRLLYGVITVFFIASVTFWGMHLAPGDPITGTKAMSPEIRANIMKKYGLDKPLLVQYRVYITNMLQGDFGISFTQQNRSVNDIIRDHFPVSAMLGLLSLFLATCGGILAGAVAAIFKDRVTDQILMTLVIIGNAVPAFVFGAIGQYIVTELNKKAGFTILPSGGWGTFRHMLVPAVFLGVGVMAFLGRLMRSSMLEVVSLDYIRTAKAKGVSPTGIFFSHQLRNAILPVITVIGIQIAFITTGGFAIETIFAIPGLGRYFVQAVQQLDYTTIMGLTVFYSGFLVFMVVFVDILYGFVDPRISVTKGRS